MICAQAEAGQAAKATADKAADAAPSDNSFLKGLFSKPQQAASSSAQQAKQASQEAADSAKDAAPSGNPLTKLFSKPEQATEAAKEAAPSSNPLNSLLNKPKQAGQQRGRGCYTFQQSTEWPFDQAKTSG